MIWSTEVIFPLHSLLPGEFIGKYCPRDSILLYTPLGEYQEHILARKWCNWLWSDRRTTQTFRMAVHCCLESGCIGKCIPLDREISLRQGFCTPRPRGAKSLPLGNLSVLGVDRSQSLFYFVPQESHSQAGSTTSGDVFPNTQTPPLKSVRIHYIPSLGSVLYTRPFRAWS